ncbi:MAG: PDZ domain-containing protein [Planctomycetota bacterium]
MQRLWYASTFLLVTLFCFDSFTFAQQARGRRPGRRTGSSQSARPQRPPADQKTSESDKTEEEQSDSEETKSDPKPTKMANVVKKVTPSLPKSVADQINFRSIGPANMGGRITAIAVYEKDPCIWWAATASGGLLKTTNNGITFEHQFDDQPTVSIGDVQVAQSNKDIVWVGTGESNPRNSVSWGDGVYKSTDGGKTWKNMGLKKSFQTGALAIHPENPDVVWVGSLGRLWGPNKERGLYKTTDGGKNWKKVLYINDKTGIIDVQLNPKNPDEMLVATYERKRDGFDGNDPVQRFGSGSGIYKSTDGGESFLRVTEGLPSCKMGRIGLDYFESDPNFVFAIIESEKIATEPENYSYLGIRGENADVGAKLTTITKDGPADKAGLKSNDIIVSVDGNIVASYTDFLIEIHKHQAGEKVEMVVSRNREIIDLEIELGKKPASNSRSRRNDFTGTLGGQSANRQDTQGPDGHEYGGVYRSSDGGSSWERINTLNPRPMYYSNIQVDPLDKNNIYVCGTSLYKSKDGGETFTGDGGTDGIHVDHHALWIDKRDPRHMILGNDGGIYITFDRMTHWDHYNHVAIGQFYHVGIDSNLDYRVYGGLQDNGSWGGPTRSANGSGIVNTDWYRVGSGDGFVTLADPEDPNQIYFESQNGGMGRIHLETGARGFIRPRERGKRFRFNWKTPFVLSPHNPKIHYSAGNYVFRSYYKGDKLKRISEEITNTDRGAGSAISESPVEPGVLYVGTTDGAVWMTKNGGADWSPLYYSPTVKDKKTETKKQADKGPSTQSEDAKTKESQPEETKAAGTAKADPITGTWTCRMMDDRIPEDRAEFSMVLKLDGEKVTGEVEGMRGSTEISSGKYVAKTGEVRLELESGRGSREYVGKLKDGKLTGEMIAGGGRFQIEFEGTKNKKDPQSTDAVSQFLMSAPLGSLTTILIVDDPISGEWNAVIEDENFPGGRIEFTIDISMDKQMKLKGQIDSAMGTVEISGGKYIEEKKKMIFEAANDEIDIECNATVNGNSMSGQMLINNGEMVAEFQATKAVVAKEESAKQPEAKPEKPSETKPTEQPVKTDEKPSADDPVSGKWSGTLTSATEERSITMMLKKSESGSISGMFETSNGERTISSGSYDKDSGELKLEGSFEQLSYVFTGKVVDKTYSGSIDLNEGSMSMDFKVQKGTVGQVSESEATAEQTEVAENSPSDEKKVVKSPVGEGSLASFLPGPRWVSSIEASRFAAGRCYITFDGHRSNDDGVYVFKTEDFGKSWVSIRANIPDSAGSVRVIREDVKNSNLLYLGCEFSAWVSIDRGESWTKLGGLPTVAVHEIAVHPTAGEIVAGTHGRSLWIADVSILRQLSKDKLAADSNLFDIKDAIRWQRQPAAGNSGTRRFVGSNPPTGSLIGYSLGKNARQVELTISNLSGSVVKTFSEVSREKGVHQIRWDLTQDSNGQSRFRRSVPSGLYQVTLRVDGNESKTTIDVKPQPNISAAAAEVMEEQLDLEMEEELVEQFLGSDED